MAVSNTFSTISRTKSNCPVYNPRARKVKPESSKREPTTLRSEGPIRDFSVVN
jgi:hypothetical protein